MARSSNEEPVLGILEGLPVPRWLDVVRVDQQVRARCRFCGADEAVTVGSPAGGDPQGPNDDEDVLAVVAAMRDHIETCRWDEIRPDTLISVTCSEGSTTIAAHELTADELAGVQKLARLVAMRERDFNWAPRIEMHNRIESPASVDASMQRVLYEHARQTWVRDLLDEELSANFADNPTARRFDDTF